MNRNEQILIKLLTLIYENKLKGVENGYELDDSYEISQEELQILCKEHESGTYINSNNMTVMKWIPQLNSFSVLERGSYGLQNTNKPLNFIITDMGKRILNMDEKIENTKSNSITENTKSNSITVSGNNNFIHILYSNNKESDSIFARMKSIIPVFVSFAKWLFGIKK